MQTTINVETLREMLDQGQPVTVLDIRPADERAEWAIPGSIYVNAYDALKANDPQALTGIHLPTDKPVVTVCGAGATSLIAADQLHRRGDNGEGFFEFVFRPHQTGVEEKSEHGRQHQCTFHGRFCVVCIVQ